MSTTVVESGTCKVCGGDFDSIHSATMLRATEDILTPKICNSPEQGGMDMIWDHVRTDSTPRKRVSRHHRESRTRLNGEPDAPNKVRCLIGDASIRGSLVCMRMTTVASQNISLLFNYINAQLVTQEINNSSFDLNVKNHISLLF